MQHLATRGGNQNRCGTAYAASGSSEVFFSVFFWGLCLFSNMFRSCCFYCSLFYFFFAFDVGCHDSRVCLLSVVVRGSAFYLVLGLLLILPAALLMWCAGRSVRRCRCGAFCG